MQKNNNDQYKIKLQLPGQMMTMMTTDGKRPKSNNRIKILGRYFCPGIFEKFRPPILKRGNERANNLQTFLPKKASENGCKASAISSHKSDDIAKR